MATSSGSKIASKKIKKPTKSRNKASAQIRKRGSKSKNQVSSILDDIKTHIKPVAQKAQGRKARLDVPSYPMPVDDNGKPVNVNPGVSPAVLKMILNLESPAERAIKNVIEFYSKHPVSRYVKDYDFLAKESEDLED